MKRNLSGVLLVLALACGVSACNSPPTTLPPAAPAAAEPSSLATPEKLSTSTPTDADVGNAPTAGSVCDLLTTAEVATATGKPMKVSADGGSAGVCVFAALDDPGDVVYLQVHSAASDISGQKAQIEGLSEHLPGLGDDAFWNAALGEVFVQRGDRAFSIGLPSLANISSTPVAIKSNMVALAHDALARF